MVDPVVLTLESLHKTFGKTVAVDGISLEIRAGEVFGLLGPNGAGKTTTISMAVGLLAPDEGSVLIGDRSPREAGTRRRIGVAPQSLALYDQLSGRENLRFFGRMYGLAGAELDRAAGAALERTGLSDRAGDRVKAYSGGMKRRLNLAVALLHEPDLLLLDEPTAGVDPQSRNALFEIIETLRAEGRTVVYTTHYMEEAQRLCDRVAIIDHGKVLALDTVDGLVDAHGGERVVTVVRDASLETVFLNLTGRSLRD